MESENDQHVALEKLEISVLNCIRRKAQTEKTIARIVGLDNFVLSPMVTDLILKGYLQTVRRRRMFFFSREYCTITAEGLHALEKARSPLVQIVELIRERVFDFLYNIAGDSVVLRLLLMSAKPAYRVAKTLL